MSLIAMPSSNYIVLIFSNDWLPRPVYGNLPFESQLADWEFAVSQHSAVPQGVLVRHCFF